LSFSLSRLRPKSASDAFSIVAYHACIYFALQEAPPAPAALLGGCTPLFIVLGSAMLPGERLRWWHIAGAIAGAEGLVCLVLEGGESFAGGRTRPFILHASGRQPGCGRCPDHSAFMISL
jgi:drug/metabolite transporter (DMT)-like permease